MRIGVYIPGVDKSIGGAYTFGYGILTSLLKYKDNKDLFVFRILMIQGLKMGK